MAMRARANLRSKLLVSAVAALVAGLSYSAFAGDPVKTRSEYDRPGRQIDESTPVKHGDGTKQFGRAADDGSKPVKTRGTYDRPGRELDKGQGGNKAKAYKPVEE
jgi:hypothetical protein